MGKLKKLVFIVILILLLTSIVGCGSQNKINKEYNAFISSAKEYEQKGLYEDALENYWDAYDCVITEEVYVGLLGVYEKMGDDINVKSVCDEAKETINEPSDELQSILERCTQLKWWITGGYDDERNPLWVEYDNKGRVTKSNINFHSFDRMSNYSTSYQFEYLDDQSVKVSYEDPEEGVEVYWLTYNEDGSIATKRFFDSNGKEREYWYDYRDGEMYEMEDVEEKGYTRTWYHTEIEFSSYNEGLIDKYLYSSFDNEFDENNNLLCRTEYKNKAYKGDDSYSYVGHDTYEWVYCTYEEYKEANKSQDYSGYTRSLM